MDEELKKSAVVFWTVAILLTVIATLTLIALGTWLFIMTRDFGAVPLPARLIP
jgi:hypothetical protein